MHGVPDYKMTGISAGPLISCLLTSSEHTRVESTPEVWFVHWHSFTKHVVENRRVFIEL
uniref:Uncharacterized protein n=1 Tax=Triticum urartu TaxID=4572 RepID=A0A8R7UE37_TRIUA